LKYDKQEGNIIVIVIVISTAVMTRGEVDYQYDITDIDLIDLPSNNSPFPSSNKKVLCIAFISFQTFAMVQLTASIVAGSESMLGDSIAMMVDALTYLFNLCAERQKDFYAIKLQQQLETSSSHIHKIPTQQNKIMILKYNKYTHQLELIPPLLSVIILLVVTGIVLKKSIYTLILDRIRDVSLQADPNVNVMSIFSFLNLLLDVMNIFYFSSSQHAMDYKIGGTNIFSDSRNSDSTEDNEDDDDDDNVSNLNMYSAYTHVFADTLRSFAIIFASLLAKFTDSITSEIADATAAVAVSILIMLSLIPLIGGMVQTYKALRDVNNILKSKESLENDEDNEDQVELLRFV